MNAHKPDSIFLNRETTAILLVDHQVGLLSGVRDIKTSELKANLVALVRCAKLMGIPVIATNVAPEMWGPLLPEVSAELTGQQVINRTLVNAWDEKNVVDAIAKTGRKQLLIAGISLEVCAAFPALSAKAAGYDARVVVDASGTFNDAKRQTGLTRLQMAGVQVVDYATAATELLHDNADPLAGPVYGAMNMDFATIVYQLKNS
jgi:nicotinamidase-related amidase